jgi:hypothetical protein
VELESSDWSLKRRKKPDGLSQHPELGGAGWKHLPIPEEHSLSGPNIQYLWDRNQISFIADLGSRCESEAILNRTKRKLIFISSQFTILILVSLIFPVDGRSGVGDSRDLYLR